jgi:hypothetical protein
MERPSAAEMLARGSSSGPVPPPAPDSHGTALRERVQRPAEQAMPPFSFDQARIALAGSLQRIAGELSFLHEMLDRSATAAHPNMAALREGLTAAIGHTGEAYMSVGRCEGCLNPRLDPKAR